MTNENANFTPTLKGYTGQQPFRYWCQTVLPLVYDDSLSYYELLNKVVNYLNNVISDVSNVEDNVQGLYNAYEQLQGYVNAYFDNLDVQIEINHKLDEMARNGTLSELISPYVSNLIGDVVAEQIDGAVALQIDLAVAGQIDDVVADQIGTPAATATTTWLNANVNPVGSAVIVDSSLSISGAAADAKTVGDDYKQIKYEMNTETYDANLANILQQTFTTNGITLSINKNTITINGTATDNVRIPISSVCSLIPIGYNYVSYWDITGSYNGGSALFYLRYQDNTYNSLGNIGSERVFTASQDNYYIQFYCQSGTSFTDYSFKFMVNKGTSKLSSFVEYGEYPKMNPFTKNSEFQELKEDVAQSKYETNEIAHSRNLACLWQRTFRENGVEVQITGNRIIVSGTATASTYFIISPITSNLPIGINYASYWDVNGSYTGNVMLYAIYTDDTYNSFGAVGVNHTGTISQGNYYIRLYVKSGTSFDNYAFTLMLSEGAVEPTEYADYSEINKYYFDVVEKAVDNVGFSCFTQYAIVGDSLSVGAQSKEDSGFMSYKPNHSWGKTVEKMYGTPCYWTGYSGATTKSWLEQTDSSDSWGLYYTQQLGTMPLYFVCMGANESDITIGTIADINDANPTTLYGYVGKLIRELRQISPNSYIVMTGISRYQQNYSAINDVYKNIANVTTKCYYYDVQNVLRTPAFMNTMVGGHYSAVGYSRMGVYYNYVMAQVIKNNESDFAYLTEID